MNKTKLYGGERGGTIKALSPSKMKHFGSLTLGEREDIAETILVVSINL